MSVVAQPDCNYCVHHRARQHGRTECDDAIDRPIEIYGKPQRQAHRNKRLHSADQITYIGSKKLNWTPMHREIIWKIFKRDLGLIVAVRKLTLSGVP